MVFIWYKTIQHRNNVKNEFNVAEHHHGSKKYTKDLVPAINVTLMK